MNLPSSAVTFLSAAAPVIDCRLYMILARIQGDYGMIQFNFETMSWKLNNLFPSTIPHGKQMTDQGAYLPCRRQWNLVPP